MRQQFLLLLVLASIILTEQAGAPLTEEQKAKFRKTCTDSSGVAPEVITKVKNGDFVDDPKVQKYFGCMLKAVGVLNKAGQLQVNVLKARAPKDLKKEEGFKIYMSCKDKKGSNVDETAYLLYKCFWEQSAPNHISLDGQ